VYDWDKFYLDTYLSNLSNVNRYCVNIDALPNLDDINDICCHDLDSDYKELCWTANFDHTNPETVREFCVAPRSIVNNNHCTVNSDCQSEQVCVSLSKYPPNEMILAMHTVERDNEPILYLGHFLNLYWSVQVSDYKPRWDWMHPFISWDIPFITQNILRFILSISGALALLNLAPVYYLDGEHAFETLLLWLLPHYPIHKRKLWAMVTFKAVSILLIGNIILSLGTLLVK